MIDTPSGSITLFKRGLSECSFGPRSGSPTNDAELERVARVMLNVEQEIRSPLRVVVDLSQIQQERPAGIFSLRASVRSAVIGSIVTTPCWIATWAADSKRSYTDPSSSRESVSSPTNAGCDRRRGTTTQPVVGGHRPAPTVTTGSPGSMSSAAASWGLAGATSTLASTVPGRIPDARIASVTPKLTSRLFRSRGRCVANVPAPRRLVTKPSSSSERSASRSVARETPRSSASCGPRKPAAEDRTRRGRQRARHRTFRNERRRISRQRSLVCPTKTVKPRRGEPQRIPP